jgi:16S rRNA processing protein RimM
MNIKDCFQIGFISKTHGLKGEVVMQILQNAAVPFTELDVIYAQQNGNLVPFFVKSVSANASQVIFALEEIDTIQKAGGLKNNKIFLPETLKSAESKGFLISDLIDYTLMDKNLGEIGLITEVFEIPNNPLIQVFYQSKEALIPVNDAFIVNFDKRKKILTMNLPDGLLDIYLSNSHSKDDGE